MNLNTVEETVKGTSQQSQPQGRCQGDGSNDNFESCHLTRPLDTVADSQPSLKHCPVIPGENIRYVVPQRIDPTTEPSAEVYLSFRVSQPVDNTRFVLEGLNSDGEAQLICRLKTKVAIPAEMIQFKLKGSNVLGFDSLLLRTEKRQKLRRRGEGSSPTEERSAYKAEHKLEILTGGEP